jgi:hypothetical protein
MFGDTNNSEMPCQSFDCTLEQLKAETEKAVRALADELASATVKGPE